MIHLHHQAKFENIHLQEKVAIAEIATQVAHDIRSPLSSIQAALSYLKDIHLEGQKFKNIFNLLELSAKRLTGIADDLLKKHKGDVPSPIIFSLHKILDELIGEFEGQEKYERLQFIKQYHSHAIELYGEPEKLQRAFGNLIKNAMEAMSFIGKIVLQTKISGNFALVAICDEGSGMTKEILNKVLAGGYTQGKADGYGIGITVVRESIEHFGGTFSVDSSPGKGTTFFLQLPLPTEVILKSANRDPQVLAKFVLNVVPSEPIIIIDDEHSMREQWRLLFQEEGLKSVLCDSYEDFEQQGITAKMSKTAIVDYHFDNSESNGLEVIHKLKARGFRNLYLCTAEYWKPSLKKQAEEMGIEICPKPLPEIELRSIANGAENKGYQVLVVDDDKTIRLAWEVIQDRLHIEKLHLFPNLESLLESGLDLTSIDIAFVDKNITDSRHDGAEVVSYLKSRGIAKVVLASGESEKQLREDPAFSQADFIVGEKIPRSFKEFFS